MKKKKFYLFFVIVSFMLLGCQKTEKIDPFEETITENEMFTNLDFDTEYEEYETITLENNHSQTESKGVTINKNTITIKQTGTYLLKGNLSKGQVIVDVGNEDKVRIILAEVSITSTDGPALYVKSAKKVFLTMKQYSYNHLNLNSEDSEQSAIYTECDLSLNGEGNLYIESNGSGICANSIIVTSGNYSVITKNIGLDSKKGIQVADGKMEINSQEDALIAQDDGVYIFAGTYFLTTGEDGIKAQKEIQIENGYFDINANGKGLLADSNISILNGKLTIQSKKEAIESGADCVIEKGTVNVSSSESNAIQVKDSFTIKGGENTISSNQKGMSANQVYINGGTTNVSSCDVGIEAQESIVIDKGRTTLLNGGIKSNGTFEMSGGTMYVNTNGSIIDAMSISLSGGSFVGVGTKYKELNFDSVTIGYIYKRFESTQKKETTIILEDSRGNVLEGYVSQLEFNILLIWSPGMSDDNTYYVTAGDESFSVTFSEGNLTSAVDIFED